MQQVALSSQMQVCSSQNFAEKETICDICT